MPRGRRALPDAVKALKGNPGKRRLNVTEKTKVIASAITTDLPKPDFEIPAFLTGDREREIFRCVVEDYLQRHVARQPDLIAYARWATYVDRWLRAKMALDGKELVYKSKSKHGELLRRHPSFKDMLDLERCLQALEDRLGLNPVARQNIIRALSVMPAALKELFSEETKPDDDMPLAPEESPLRWMANAGKVH